MRRRGGGDRNLARCNLTPDVERGGVVSFEVRVLDETTWPGFARLVERHNGVWGGCWCMNFHSEGVGRGHTAEGNRTAKERRVRAGQAHAALVYDGPACVGWCQFGPTEELPRIKRRAEYLKNLVALPDWRITCFFVDRDYRGKSVAATALEGALREIARLGGGTVESYPEDIEGRSVSSSFLHNGTVSMFESQGFVRTRRLGKHHWVVTRVVPGPGI
jgi:GNAT superfamily N-acetyltransferase